MWVMNVQIPLFTSIMLPLFVSFVSYEKEALLTHMMRFALKTVLAAVGDALRCLVLCSLIARQSSAVSYVQDGGHERPGLLAGLGHFLLPVVFWNHAHALRLCVSLLRCHVRRVWCMRCSKLYSLSSSAIGSSCLAFPRFKNAAFSLFFLLALLWAMASTGYAFVMGATVRSSKAATVLVRGPVDAETICSAVVAGDAQVVD